MVEEQESGSGGGVSGGGPSPVVTISGGSRSNKYHHKGAALARVKVYNESLRETLVEEAPRVVRGMTSTTGSHAFGLDIMQSTSAMRKAKKLTQLREKRHAEELKQRRLQQLQARQVAIKEANERKIKEELENKTAKREVVFQVKYKDVMEGQHLSKQVKRMIDLLDENGHIKTIKQYQDWNDLVYGHFQRAIEKEVKGLDVRELNKRRCDAYQEFIDQTNKKPSIFRDIIIESEYDPLELNRKTIKIRTSHALRDPVRRATQRTEEEASILADKSAPRPPSSKETLDVKLWASGKIEDTPHGCFAKMMREGRSAESCTYTLASASKLRASRVVFDHYGTATTSQATTSSQGDEGRRPGTTTTGEKKHFKEEPPKATTRTEGVRVFKDKLSVDHIDLH